MKFVDIITNVSVEAKFQIQGEEKNVFGAAVTVESGLLKLLTRMYIVSQDVERDFLEDFQVTTAEGSFYLDPYHLVFEKDNEKYLITNIKDLIGHFVKPEHMPQVDLSVLNPATEINGVRWYCCEDTNNNCDLDRELDVYYWVSEEGKMFPIGYDNEYPDEVYTTFNSLFFLHHDVEEDVVEELKSAFLANL